MEPFDSDGEDVLYDELQKKEPDQDAIRTSITRKLTNIELEMRPTIVQERPDYNAHREANTGQKLRRIQVMESNENDKIKELLGNHERVIGFSLQCNKERLEGVALNSKEEILAENLRGSCLCKNCIQKKYENMLSK